jgi:hypothetical protein
MLEFYTSLFDCYKDSLQEVCNTIEEDDIEIIKIVTECMSNARNHLFDYDL